MGIRPAPAPRRAKRAVDDLQELRGGHARAGISRGDCAPAAARHDAVRNRQPEARRSRTARGHDRNPSAPGRSPDWAGRLLPPVAGDQDANATSSSSAAAVPTRHCSSCSATRCIFTTTAGLYEQVGGALIREFGIDELVSPARTVQARSPCHAVRASTQHQRPPLAPDRCASGVHCHPDGARRDTPPRVPRFPGAAGLSGRSHRGHRRRQRLERRIQPRRCDARFPDARVIRNETNIGFAAGNNQGAAASTGDYVIFLNDDTRVASGLAARARGDRPAAPAAAVASYILDWSGTKVDFVDGAVNFQGKGFQLDYGTPADA